MLADRAPTPTELAGPSEALSAQGYSTWGKIEFDEGPWEVDNALDIDGKRCDLKLDRNYTVRESERD